MSSPPNHKPIKHFLFDLNLNHSKRFILRNLVTSTQQVAFSSRLLLLFKCFRYNHRIYLKLISAVFYGLSSIAIIVINKILLTTYQ